MESTDEKYAYFQPGEIVFLMRHGNDQSSAASAESVAGNQNGSPQPAANDTHNAGRAQASRPIIDQLNDNQTDQEKRDLIIEKKIRFLIDWGDQQAKKMDPKQTVTRRKERERHFHSLSRLNSKFNLKPEIPNADLRYRSPNIKPPSTFSIIPVNAMQDPAPWDDNPDGFVEESKLAYLIKILDEARQDPELIKNGIQIDAVSPNWLSSPTSEWGGGGGPGSRPVPYNGNPANAPYKIQLPTLKALCSSNENEWGKGVRVAILDTSPSSHDLVWAYEKYHKVNPRKQKKHHPLIESLLRPCGPLHLHSASVDDLLRMRAVHLRDHNYNMTDHGLFVAGIIHTIAPAAEIHLYEVLNSEGVGDLVTIYNTLANILDERISEINTLVERDELHKLQPLVINCSLTLNIPLNGDPNFPESAAVIASNNPLPVVGHRLTDLDQPFLQIIEGDKTAKLAPELEWAQRTSQGIKDVCDALFLSGSRVIAAAGNDWIAAEDQGRPRARFLAAFDSVQGVGALQKNQSQQTIAGGNYAVASYSDLSDEPSDVGVVTLGGEAGEGKGVLGIYLGEFPPLEKLSFRECLKKCLIELLGGQYAGPKNKSNWAWWAGTSFATPIMTGAVAAVLSKLDPPAATEAAIVKMYNEKAIVEKKTPYEEDLLKGTQG